MDINKLSSLSEEFFKLAKNYNSPRKGMKSRWSTKYKKKIDCNKPKGFSQKAYCARKRRGGDYKSDVNDIDFLSDLASKFKEKAEEIKNFFMGSKPVDKDEKKDVSATLPSGYSGSSKACIQALVDANSKWKNRDKKSDGIMGDKSHQDRKSDHNVGNAVDITHDPQGCSGDKISEMAIRDPRVSYVIWNGKIWSPSKGWTNYKGPNPHTNHVHISVKKDHRDDNSHWPWA